MIFVHLTDGEHEWGYEVEHGYLPAVGDEVRLWIAVPDGQEPANDDSIRGIVTKRSLGFISFGEEGESELEYYVDVIVELLDEIPPTHVPDSWAWPAAKWSQRKRQLEVDLESIKAGLPVDQS